MEDFKFGPALCFAILYCTLLFAVICGVNRVSSKNTVIEQSKGGNQADMLISEADNTVTVSAKSTIRVVPDKAEISIGVSTEDADAVKAQEKNDKRVGAIITALKEISIDEKSIQTNNVNLWPQYDYSTDKEILKGFQAETQLLITGLDIDMVGEVMNICLKAGATNVYDLNFKSSKYSETYRRALSEALEISKEKAEALALTAGCKVTGVKSIEEGYQNDYIAFNKVSNAVFNSEDAGVSMGSIQPGELEVNANVTVTYRLSQAAKND